MPVGQFGSLNFAILVTCGHSLKQKAKDLRNSSADVLRKQVSSKQKDNEISFIFWVQIAENCPTILLILHWHKTLDALP